MGKNMTGICLVASMLLPTVEAAGRLENGRFKTTVIEDRGGVPIQKYIPNIQTPDDWAKERYQDRGNKKLTESMYPVRTPSMTVGRVGLVEGEKIPKIAMQIKSMFIIGDDPVSIRWLVNNREFLRNNKAIGLVVNVENKERMAALKHVAGKGVLLQPIPGKGMAETMGIRHYPFFVNEDGIMR
jgi:integrating conjugative element protein (TIGR03765 family)